MAGTQENEISTLHDYLQVIRRRKWIILLATVLVPAAAVSFSLAQPAQFRGSAQVLLSQQNLGSQLTGTQPVQANDTNWDSTQAQVARAPKVAAKALRAARINMSPQALLGASSVTAGTTTDILTFHVTNHDPALASRLAAAYAHAYVAYSLEIETSSIVTARHEVEARIAKTPRGTLYNTLVAKEQTLEEMQALETSNASVISTAGPAVQTAPRTKRNGVLGLVLGIVLGIGLAFLWETLDTRVRNTQEIGKLLGGLPLLARLPAPSKKLREDNELVMLAAPGSVQAEAFRMLRTNLDFVNLDHEARTLMVTSAVEQEGKSTTIANLAIALARAGKRVILVDLDLRRPLIDRFFGLTGPGLTQVTLGHATLEQALCQIAITDPEPQQAPSDDSGNGNGNGNGQSGGKLVKGTLEVLPSGPIPPDPGEFAGTLALSAVLEQLRDRADVVLVDSPPVLRVGDAMTLSRNVDAIIVVTRMKVVRRHMLSELGRQLATVPKPVLGFAVTGTGEEEGYYGYGSDYNYGRYMPRYEQREKTRA